MRVEHPVDSERCGQCFGILSKTKSKHQMRKRSVCSGSNKSAKPEYVISRSLEEAIFGIKDKRHVVDADFCLATPS